MNSVEDSNWQEGWLEDGTSHREQGEEHANGWWNEERLDGWWKDEQQTIRHLGNQKDQEGGFEINSVEPKYIKHDRWEQEWLMLNYDSGAAVTALPVAVAGDLPLDKRGEFRVASGAVIPNLGKIKMKCGTHHGSCQASTEGCGGLQEVGLSSLRGRRDPLGNENFLLLWLSEQFLKSTRSGIVTARASDFTEKATCTTLTCELAMSHRSLHRSNQPRRAGPGWTWTMEITMSRMKPINVRSSRESQLTRQPTEMQRQKHFQTNHAVFAPWCEVCVL